MTSGTPLPAYRAFFQNIQSLEAAANNTTAQEATELRTYHQRKIGLTDREATQIKTAAATNVAAIATIEQQAAAIIAEARAKFPGGTLPLKACARRRRRGSGQLQQQRDILTAAHIHGLQNQLGAGSSKKARRLCSANLCEYCSYDFFGHSSSRPTKSQQTGKLMNRSIFIIAILLLSSLAASGQYAYTSTSISATTTSVYANAYTEVDYNSAYDYYVRIVRRPLLQLHL